MDIAILGSGAMGSLFGGLLSADGHDVTLIDVWEKHVHTINESGLTITELNGTERTVDVPAVSDPDAAAPVDLVVVFVKSTDTKTALADAEPILDTADVLTLQNGLGNPETIAEFVSETQIIAGVTAHGSTLEAPGHISHAGVGSTSIGRYFDENDPTVEYIAEAFSRAGIDTEVTDDIRDAVWEKVLVNVGINASTALSRVQNGRLADTKPGTRLLQAAVTEAIAVARSEGRTVREDIVSHVKAVAEATGANTSSMRQDIEAGRQTEIERLNGEIVRLADQHDIEVPINRTMADLVRLAERSDELP
ncbi:ketopantoate reductase family protein [Halocatena marina]|uniref:ketopantoate reductase family protein n=1 Tax=Halocatena marina TaxID=2934937 RepID=UPI0020101393|nr:2-dehydropantoate 2-reductase [Halocatena marina]